MQEHTVDKKPSTVRTGRKTSLFIILIPILIIYIVLAFGIITISYAWTNPLVNNGWDSFAKVAGLGITLLTSFLTAAISLIVFWRQSIASEQIELIKGDLSSQLEILKTRLSSTVRALDAMNGAAVFYYYTLAKLETGVLDPTDAETAERKMVEASTYQYTIDEQYLHLWKAFWQEARFIKELAFQNRSDVEKNKKIWKEHSFGFGTLYNKFLEKSNSLLPNA